MQSKRVDPERNWYKLAAGEKASQPGRTAWSQFYLHKLPVSETRPFIVAFAGAESEAETKAASIFSLRGVLLRPVSGGGAPADENETLSMGHSVVKI